MSKGNYFGQSQIKLPFNFGLISKLSRDVLPAGFGNPYQLKNYTNAMVENLLLDDGVNRDLPRTHWMLGKNQTLFTGGFCHERKIHDEEFRAAGFRAFVAAASANNITMTIEEAKAFYAFCVSSNGLPCQGGIIHASYVAFTESLIPFLGLHKTDAVKNTYLTQTADHQFRLGMKYALRNFIDINSNEHIGDVINLIDAELTFLITSDNGVFTIEVDEDNSMMYIERKFWDMLLPRVNAQLAADKPLDKNAVGCITPFLIDKEIAGNYISRISKQPELLESASEFISVCYKNDEDYKDYLLTKLSLTAHLTELQNKIDRLVNVEYKKISMDNIYAQADLLKDGDRKDYFNKISYDISKALKAIESNDGKEIIKESYEIPLLNLEMAKVNLDEALRSDDCDSMLSMRAKLVLEELSALDATVRLNNIDVITDTINQMYVAIAKPQNLNIEETQTLLKKLDSTSWGKAIVGSLIVLFSTALLTFSIGAAIASFGASSFVSALGVSVAVNLFTQLFTIGVGASALVAVGAGAKLVSTSRPMHQFTNASQSFWKIAQPKVASASLSHSELESVSSDPLHSADCNVTQAGSASSSSITSCSTDSISIHRPTRSPV